LLEAFEETELLRSTSVADLTAAAGAAFGRRSDVGIKMAWGRRPESIDE
jgi:hypothetical protein